MIPTGRSLFHNGQIFHFAKIISGFDATVMHYSEKSTKKKNVDGKKKKYRSYERILTQRKLCHTRRQLGCGHVS